MKGIIIYKGKYGATQQYADWMAKDLTLPSVIAQEMPREQIATYDYIIMGSSVYVGKLQLKKWLKVNADLLSKKKLFLFIVCGTPSNEIEKIEKIVQDNIPVELCDRCSITFLPGRLVKKNLSWTDKMLLRIASLFYKNKAGERNPYSDYDNVKQENIIKLESNVISYLRDAKREAHVPFPVAEGSK